MTVDGPVRTVEIRSPRAREETLNVLRATFHIALWSAILISGQTRASAAAGANELATEATPFVRRFADLDAKDQRVFRALQEGLGEAERARGAAGVWPTVEALARDGIPPFAPDAIDTDNYVWARLSGKGVVNYVGTPSKASGRATFLAILTEPDPATPIDSDAPVDEIHHRLANGTMIHVSVFLGPFDSANLREPILGVNFDQGIQQVLVGPVSVLGR